MTLENYIIEGIDTGRTEDMVVKHGEKKYKVSIGQYDVKYSDYIPEDVQIKEIANIEKNDKQTILTV